MINKVVKAIKEGGITTLLVRSGRYTFKVLNIRKPVKYKNVTFIHPQQYFNYIMPFLKVSYEPAVLKASEKFVEKNDDVTVIGGGRGITAAKSYKQSQSGTLNVYEGNKSFCKKIMPKTFNLNNVKANIHHAIVGPGNNVYGNQENPEKVNPSKLPECDVLELDCEGSEIEILNNITIKPRVIIVESHGMYNSSSNEVKKCLQNLGYNIAFEQYAEEGDFVVKNDVKVIAGVKK